MRFDDRLTTALKQPVGLPTLAIVQWQQLIDILAQHPRGFAMAEVAAGLERILVLDAMIDEAQKVAVLRSLNGRLRSPPLITLLSGMSPNICAAAISSAHLQDSEWADLIPELSSRARGYLRNRRDLGPLSLDMLDRWRSADFRLSHAKADADADAANNAPVIVDADETAAVLPAPECDEPSQPVRDDVEAGTDADAHEDVIEEVARAQSPELQKPGQQIGALLKRIENFRRHRASLEAPQLPLEGGEEHIFQQTLDSFAFRTDDNGVIIDAENVPRGALVGISISEPAFDDMPGPDAYAASAFNQRMPIENARMRLLGAEVIAGDWRITAEPFFDNESGRFRGYEGEMRRPTHAENAVIEAMPVERSEQLQQLLHELRTPLGAIIGFGEIIEQQLFGPVSTDYRELASSILDDARRLLAGFDDVSLAARLDSGKLDQGDGTTSADWLFERIGQRLQSVTDIRAIDLNLHNVEPMRPFALDHMSVERIFTRLLSAILLATDKGETIEAKLRTIVGTRPSNLFQLKLPKALRDLDEDKLFEAGSDIGRDGEGDAPLLGLGFSLRLVRNLARNAGGDLRFLNGDLLLHLPATRMSGAAKQ